MCKFPCSGCKLKQPAECCDSCLKELLDDMERDLIERGIIQSLEVEDNVAALRKNTQATVDPHLLDFGKNKDLE